jgi:DNA-binding NarL/FixJ family response regulator
VEAIAEFRRHRPDVTLMDLRLPGTSGTDVLIAIRGEYRDARVIMLTTSDGDGDIQRAMRAGASGYVLKSMHMDELLSVIRFGSWKFSDSFETAIATNRLPINWRFRRTRLIFTLRT